MKNKFYTLAIGLVLLLLPLALRAQSVTIKVADWNIRSFEKSSGAGQTLVDDIQEYVDFIKGLDADIITLNEFETATSRQKGERMAELASRLGMYYSYYIMSYPKGEGWYGNVILSRYPIINSASVQMKYKNYKGEGYYDHNSGSELEQYGADQRSVGYADVMIPSGSGAGRMVRIVCSHFDHQGSESVRTNQAKESVSFASLASPVYPTIMMGDLNTSSSATLEPLFSLGDHPGYYWVDHIFTFPKGAFSATGFESPSSGLLSDHNPVCVTLSLD